MIVMALKGALLYFFFTMHSGFCIVSHIVKLVVRGFLWVLWFPLLLHQLMVSANEIKLKEM